jgi:hypothetical protein
MRSLTRDQFLKIFGLSSGAFDAQQRAGHVALAFGTRILATPGRYFDLDLAAMAIVVAACRPSVGASPAAFDNLSAIPAWLSDSLCRLASGGSFAVRQLYTDDDEVPRRHLRTCL